MSKHCGAVQKLACAVLTVAVAASVPGFSHANRVRAAGRPSLAVPADGQAICSINRIHITPFWEGATGSMGGITRLRNNGPRCSLKGYATVVAAYDGNGDRLPIRPPRHHPHGHHKIILRRGGYASFLIVWSNWCGSRVRLPMKLLVRLPGRSTTRLVRLNLRLNGRKWAPTPRCDLSSGPSIVRTGVIRSGPDR